MPEKSCQHRMVMYAEWIPRAGWVSADGEPDMEDYYDHPLRTPSDKVFCLHCGMTAKQLEAVAPVA